MVEPVPLANPTAAVPTAAATGVLRRECKAHLDFLRRNCPEVLASATTGLPPGSPAGTVPLDPRRGTSLLQVAVQQAVLRDLGGAPAGRPPDGGDGLPGEVVWTHGADSLLVLLDRLQVTTGEGLVTVTVPVACDELAADRGNQGSPIGQVVVELLLGTSDRPTGLLAAATPPQGPDVVVRRWSDQLVALAWRAVLDAAAGLAAQVGTDADGSPLVPTTWTASADGMSIGPQARHPLDRVVTTSSGVGAVGAVGGAST
ncbi:hypothetical protein [Angustibacter aerolatus]